MSFAMTGVRNVLIQLTVVGTLSGMTLTLVWVVQRLRAGHPLLIRQPPRTSSWTWITVLFVITSWVAANWICRDAYLELRGQFGWRVGPPPGNRPTGLPGLTFTEQMFLVTIINALLLVAIPLILRAWCPSLAKELGLTRGCRRGAAKSGALAFFLVTPCVYAVNGLAQQFFATRRHPLELMLREEMSPLGIVLAIVSAVVLAPAVEELIFRGILQAWMTRLFVDQALREQDTTPRRFLGFDTPPGDPPSNAVRQPAPPPAEDNPFAPPLSPIGDPPSSTGPSPSVEPPFDTAGRFAVITTSFLFALVHAPQMPAPFAIFALSLALGILYQRTGSLLSCFTLHALFNGMSTLLLLVSSS